MPAHIKSSKELIERLNGMEAVDLSKNIPLSFDVASLYTNINTDEAIDTPLRCLEKFNIDVTGLALHDIEVLLDLLLNNNILRRRFQIWRCYLQANHWSSYG